MNKIVGKIVTVKTTQGAVWDNVYRNIGGVGGTIWEAVSADTENGEIIDERIIYSDDVNGREYYNI